MSVSEAHCLPFLPYIFLMLFFSISMASSKGMTSEQFQLTIYRATHERLVNCVEVEKECINPKISGCGRSWDCFWHMVAQTHVCLSYPIKSSP